MKDRRQDIYVAASVLLALATTPCVLQAQGALALTLFVSQSLWLPLLLFVVLGVAAAAGTVAYRRYRRRRRAAHRRQTRDEIPPLVFPAAPATQDRRARRQAAPFGGAPAAAPVPAMAAADATVPAPSPGASAPPPFPIPLPEASGTVVDGRSIRFHQPVDGTLQILPGRLDIVEGAESGHSIRFVRTPGAPEITFGRSDGPAYKHIQLRAPTVSRRHAQMRFDGSGWSITNLSQTNPVVVNGGELGDGVARELSEGDRIEMGEIVFVFRER